MSDHLAPEELWGRDGHASELVLVALADGEDAMVPAGVAAHVETCPVCSDRLGEMAMLSLATGDALAAIPRASAPESVTPTSAIAGLPRYALIGALGLGSIASLPRLFELHESIEEVPSSLPGLLLLMSKGASVLFRSASSEESFGAALVWCSAALVLLGFGWFIARLAPVKRASGRTHELG